MDPRICSIPNTSIKNKIIEDIVDNASTVTKNQVLVDKLIHLRDLKLLNPNTPYFNRLKGIGKVDFVYNDYHSKATNPGYSRTPLGTFFCK